MAGRGGITVAILAIAGLIVLGFAWWLGGRSAPVELPDLTLAGLDPEVRALIERQRDAALAAPADATRALGLGMALEANGLPVPARACFEAVVTARPGDRDAWYRLAMTCMALGELAAAIEAMTRVTELDPSLAEAHARLGLWLQESGRADAAMDALDRALAIEPSSDMALVGAALVHLDRGDPGAAIATIRGGGLLEGPNAAYAWRLLAIAHRRRGEPDLAAGATARAGDARPAWPDLHERALADLERGLTHRKAAARRLRDAGDLEGALRELRALAEDHPGDVEVLDTLAACYLEMKRYPECIATLREALAIRPRGFTTNMMAAEAHMALAPAQPAALETALAHSQVAVEARPETVRPHLVQARVLMAAGNRAEAIDVLRRAAELDARDATALCQAGLLSWELGRHAEALELFATAAQRDPSSATPLVGQALALIGLGRRAEATGLLDAAAQRPQEHPQLLELAQRKLAGNGP